MQHPNVYFFNLDFLVVPYINLTCYFFPLNPPQQQQKKQRALLEMKREKKNKGSLDTNLSSTEYVLEQKINLRRQSPISTQDWDKMERD